MLVQFLEVSGFKVLSAETGERALLILRDRGRRIDWLFTAIMLPGLVDGWIVADEFRLHHPDRTVVHASTVEGDLAQGASSSVFVKKPVSPLDVSMIIKRLAEADPVRERQSAAPVRAVAAAC